MHANCKQQNTAVTKTKQEDWRLDPTGINEADAAQINTMACCNSFENGYIEAQGGTCSQTCFDGLSKGSPVSTDIAVTRSCAAPTSDSLGLKCLRPSLPSDT